MKPPPTRRGDGSGPSLAAPGPPLYLPRAVRLALPAAATLAVACATLGPVGPPLDDPAGVARRALASPDDPATLRFRWRYAGRRGEVEGEGVARFNPPDSLRIDLFTSGDVALAVSLTGDALATVGEIEEVELPAPSFLYAMAGIFRPPAPTPAGGYHGGPAEVLVYPVDGGSELHFHLEERRLTRVEERRDGRRLRRLELDRSGASRWPGRAEYRDLAERSRVRWELTGAEVTRRHPPHVYELAPAP